MALFFLNWIAENTAFTLGVAAALLIGLILINQRTKKPAEKKSEEKVPSESAALAPTTSAPVASVTPALPKSDLLEVEKLKHGMVILHAQQTKALVRSSALQSEIEVRDEKHKVTVDELAISKARIAELQKYVSELEKTLREINSEVLQHKHFILGEKPKWKLGVKLSQFFSKFKLNKDTNNLINMIVGEYPENSSHDPVSKTPAQEPNSTEEIKKAS